MMFKLIIVLLIISTINCADDKITFSDDEIDITKAEDKPKPEIKSDENDVSVSKVDEELSKDKKLEPELDSGKDIEKKVDINNDKEIIKAVTKVIQNNEDYNKDVVKEAKKKFIHNEDNTDVVKEEDKKKVIIGSEEEVGVDKEVTQTDKEDGKQLFKGNQFMDSVLDLMKKDYAKDLDKVSLSDYGPVKHGRWGTVALNGGFVSGLSNIHRVGDILIKISDQNKKLIIGDIAVTDVNADFNVDAKLFHRINIKNRKLNLWFKKALLSVVLEVDPLEKKLTISELHVKSIEDFGVKSGRLFWPFNKLANVILKRQEEVIRDIMKAEISKYMGKTIHNIKFEEVFAKLF